MLRRAAICWGCRTEDEQHTIRFEDEDSGVEIVYEQAFSSVFMLGPFLIRAQLSFGALNRLFPEIVRYLSEKYQISLQYIDVLTQARAQPTVFCIFNQIQARIVRHKDSRAQNNKTRCSRKTESKTTETCARGPGVSACSKRHVSP